MSFVGRVLGLLVPRLRSPGQPPQDGAALYFATLGSRLRYLLYDGTDRWLVDSSHRGAQGGVEPMAVVTTTAPTTGDDTNDGYVAGQHWIDTSGRRAYVCSSATAGAAVWLSPAMRSLLATTDFTTIAAAAVFQASNNPLGGLLYKATNVAIGTTAVKAYGQTATSVQFRGSMLWDIDGVYTYAFIGLRDSAGGKFVTLGLYKNGAGNRLSAGEWNSLSAYSTETAGTTLTTNQWSRLMAGEPIRLRIWNTGGNRSYEYALGDDGWTVLTTKATTYFCTPDQRIVGSDPSNSSSGTTGIWLYEFGDAA